MRRALLVAGLVALVSAPAGAAPPPGRLQVVAREFTFSLSRAKLRPGQAIVELVNFGEDAHDLRLRRSAARGPTGSQPCSPARSPASG